MKIYFFYLNIILLHILDIYINKMPEQQIPLRVTDGSKFIPVLAAFKKESTQPAQNQVKLIENIQKKLDFLAESVCLDQPLNKRKKIEHLIIELIHQRDITNDLMKKKKSLYFSDLK